MDKSIKDALLKNFLHLSKGLKQLTPKQLGVNVDYVQALSTELDNAIERLTNNEPLQTDGISEGEQDLHDQIATLQTELNETKFKLEATESELKNRGSVLEAIQRAEQNVIETLTKHSK